ncbi:hypothetical protein PVK06_014608 [Gossypium arboreum]|uniref:Secreted protein n=1 Tax=Gossypium arboreum TaxID=29729 RepID=A0ABR0PVU0_GOSAR|nr:hypothetical protein PVK06_014608 [Gossypium arboreum]
MIVFFYFLLFLFFVYCILELCLIWCLIVFSFWPLEKTLEERSGSAGPFWASFVHLTTALRREPCEKIRRGKECMQAFPKFLIASPSFHGGRGALPSAGGHPADLTYLAGGGC